MAEATVVATVVVVMAAVTVVDTTAAAISVVIMAAAISAATASVTRISVAAIMAARGSEPSRGMVDRTSASSAVQPCVPPISAMR